MINIKINNVINFDFHKENYKKKQDKLILEKVDVVSQEDIKKEYEKYEKYFSNNELQKIKNTPSIFQDKETAKKYHEIMFNHKNQESNLFFKMKQNITDSYGFTVCVCPYCYENNAKTLDHIIPKDGDNGYAEFCDLPLNLIPMCSDCNEHKSSIWLDENNKLKYLNLYIDKVPDVKFLKAQAYMEKGLPKITIEFFGDNILEDTLKNKLSNTLCKFHITELYEKTSFEKEIAQLKQEFRKYKQQGKTENEIKKNIIDLTDDDNNQRNLIRLACVNNPDVLHFLYS